MALSVRPRAEVVDLQAETRQFDESSLEGRADGPPSLEEPAPVHYPSPDDPPPSASGSSPDARWGDEPGNSSAVISARDHPVRAEARVYEYCGGHLPVERLVPGLTQAVTPVIVARAT